MGFWNLIFGDDNRVIQAPPLKLVPLTGTQRALQQGRAEEHLFGLEFFSKDVFEAVINAELKVAETAVITPKTGIYFKEGEPRTFKDYGAQTHITRYFSAIFRGWTGVECSLPPQVFSGTAGGGKTLLAKVTTNEINCNCRERGLPEVDFIEVFTSDVPNIAALDRYMRRVQANPGCVFFIDELHSLVGKEHWYKFYLVLEEGRYLFEGDKTPTKLPPFTILAATTDFGLLPEALRRRFMSHTLERATYEQLLSAVTKTSQTSGRPLTDEAAHAIVERMHYGGAPWEVIGTYHIASVFSKARGDSRVTIDDVKEVWDVNQIDELGLSPVDRRVIKAILSQPRSRRNPEGDGQEFVCYASSESNTYQMAKVDRAEYIDYIRPKLMARGLMEIRITYGQALTNKCVELYNWLKDT